MAGSDVPTPVITPPYQTESDALTGRKEPQPRALTAITRQKFDVLAILRQPGVNGCAKNTSPGLAPLPSGGSVRR